MATTTHSVTPDDRNVRVEEANDARKALVTGTFGGLASVRAIDARETGMATRR